MNLYPKTTHNIKRKHIAIRYINTQNTNGTQQMNGILKRLKFKMGKYPKHSILQRGKCTRQKSIHARREERERAAQKKNMIFWTVDYSSRAIHKAQRATSSRLIYPCIVNFFFFCLKRKSTRIYIACTVFGAGIVSYWSKCISTFEFRFITRALVHFLSLFMSLSLFPSFLFPCLLLRLLFDRV